MIDTTPDFAPFADKMRAEGLPEIAIRTFGFYYDRLCKGDTGTLAESQIEPVSGLADAERLQGTRSAGQKALAATVVIKLNGGLGTSMGMTRAKSLLPVKDGYKFLDVIARQILHLRQQHACRLPLVLMNSFRTRDDSLQALESHPELGGSLPLDFVQHKVPRILADSLEPVQWPADPNAEWCPPGHGDLYTALRTSGMLEQLLDQGFETAFISNSDNLGAVLDLDILGWFVQESSPFLMEVADRTEADKKGGHLARLADGRLVLRESAQCPGDEKERFQDIARYQYFNTNNLWVNLRRLDEVLQANDQVIPLPMIRNEKTVDPADASTPSCLQLETAMGAALSVFEGAQALRVPRSRFAPVKTTNDLLCLWSDAYTLDESWQVLPRDAEAQRARVIDLDPRYYKTMGEFERRFPHGAPSLQACRRLTVRGDVFFGRGVIVKGDVTIEHTGDTPRVIPDEEVLGG